VLYMSTNVAILIISRAVLFRMRNSSEKKVVEKAKTRFMFGNFF
jgi:hypothetical protein